MHAQIFTAASAIAGRGLFTSESFGVGETVVRLPGPVAAPEDLGGLNHSCDPTLWWSSATTLTTRRAVADGEELTLDYATALDDPDLVLMCHCQTYRCRQLVAGDDWRIPQLQSRYAGHWAPRLQTRIDSG